MAAAAGIFRLFRFTAEDAYITARVARNLLRIGQPVYNAGEAIQTFTSPLHLGLEALFHALPFDPILVNKTLGLAAVGLSARLVFRRLPVGSPFRPAAVAAILLNPAVLLWAVGGLETPYLMLWITALGTQLQDAPSAMSMSRRLAVAGLMGLAVLTRLDSSVFLLPLIIGWLVRIPRRGRTLGAGLLGLIPVGIWMGFAWHYYGDPLPTSFYVKTPGWSIRGLRNNTLYSAQFYLASGLCSMNLMALVARRWRAPTFRMPGGGNQLLAGKPAAFLALFVYALSAAQTHMFFSYRLFVPYFPLMVLAALEAAERAWPPDNFHRRRAGLALWGLLAIQMVLLTQMVVTRSLTPGVRSEYSKIGARAYTESFMKALGRSTEAIERHWADRSRAAGRRPRLLTFAGGQPPYRLESAYVLEALASYRHRCRPDRVPIADYLQLLIPRNGSLEKQLGGRPLETYGIVDDRRLPFDGMEERLLTLYNPQASPNPLPPRIDEPCRTIFRIPIP